ncbi:tricarboxylate transport protein TctC [Saccharobesus litoralis]|uniref:Tricarboxylate transport protein TctC n=1 Tax=Saccharobesus litoralis TaxID=2172099 RepID=A0A2S0VNS5_9ALTE|nr:tripartite tricarboxylate transporter substrate binding protein [Saccharobesus litoralis]AWB65864.1 tricarboxylate transport protein TctC [Saccharobesus litoralis]
MTRLIPALVIFTSLLSICLPTHAAKKYPYRPITNTVVWGAGGGTDSINRMIMAEMEKELGVKVRVANKTGGIAGSIGMKYVHSKRPDGYNLVGISESNVTSSVNGGWNKRFDQWWPFIVGGSPDIISVAANSPYTDLKQLIEASKANPKTIKVAAGDIGSIHHLNMLALVKGTGASFKFIPYPGSAKSQTAVLTGEVDIVITSVAEQAALIRGKKLKPLATLTPSAFSGDNIPIIVSALSIYPTLHEHLPIKQAIGFAVHAQASPSTKLILGAAFEKAMQSDKVKSWAKQNYYQLSGKHGLQAKIEFSRLESLFAWTLYDLGAVNISPQVFGIDKPKLQ